MGPRVLVVGGHIAENQFVRQVRAAGCEVTWHNGNPGKSFPHFCDALVCAKYQLSHEGFWAAKAAYKGKPTFIADHSWSTIKEKFELFVDDWELKHETTKQTTLGAAMQKALTNGNGSASGTPARYIVPAQAAKPTSGHVGGRIRYSEQQKEYLLTFIKNARLKKMTYQEIINSLNSTGKRRSDGKPFKIADISYWIEKLENYKVKPRAEATATAPTPTQETRGTDKLVYELILSANLPPTETTALMRRCMDGKLSQNDALKFIELYTDIKGGI